MSVTTDDNLLSAEELEAARVIAEKSASMDPVAEAYLQTLKRVRTLEDKLAEAEGTITQLRSAYEALLKHDALARGA